MRDASVGDGPFILFHLTLYLSDLNSFMRHWCAPSCWIPPLHYTLPLHAPPHCDTTQFPFAIPFACLTPPRTTTPTAAFPHCPPFYYPFPHPAQVPGLLVAFTHLPTHTLRCVCRTRLRFRARAAHARRAHARHAPCRSMDNNTSSSAFAFCIMAVCLFVA